MIKCINKDDMNHLLTNNCDMPELGNEVKNHDDWILMEMRSEDGTNFLQGVLAAEAFHTKAGINVRMERIWVAPECRNIGFGRILVDHAKQEAETLAEMLESPLSSIAITLKKDDDGALQFVKKLGWSVEERARSVIAWI